MLQPQEAISLFELSTRIKDVLRHEFTELIWIRAEINQLNRHSSGHVYLELIEKETHSDRIRASVRATIWATVYQRLAAWFRSGTGLELTSGIKVLIRVQVEFHEVYGLSLNIRDIDPAYTLGDLARKRVEILKKLEQNGVIDMNRELSLARVPQRIAVISSPSAAGYEDFCEQLDRNPEGYAFIHHLYPAIMQGDQTAASIIRAFDQIAEQEYSYDAVVLIRGGGSKTDLSFFDDYNLAYYITQFPLPVVTGIGHERDESVCDLVAHTACKTPTAVAEFLIDQALGFDRELEWLKERIIDWSRKSLHQQSTRLDQDIQAIKLHVRQFRSEEKHQLNRLAQLSQALSREGIRKARLPLEKIQNGLPASLRSFIVFHHHDQQKLLHKSIHLADQQFSARRHQLQLFEKEVRLLHPVHILKRGYSITLLNGKPVKNAAELKEGETITTRLYQGSVSSTVKS